MEHVTRYFVRFARKILPVLMAAPLLPGTAFAEKVLRYSDHEPLGGMRTHFLKEVFFAAIEKESHGRLKIDAHWDAELSSGYDALGTVGRGQVADMATVVPEYTAKELPLHQVFKSFPVGAAGAKQVSFFRRAYAAVPELSAEMSRQNVVPVLLSTGYPVAFFSTHRLDSLADINGQTWRSASFWHQDFLKNAGAAPVSIRWGDEVLKALAAKTLDGVMVNVDSGYMLKVHEIAPQVLVSKNLWLGHLYLVAMNRDTWNGLASEDKLAIQRAADTAYKALGAIMDVSYDAMLDDLKKGGASVRQLESDELASWAVATQYQEVQKRWVREQEDKGVANSRSVLDQVTEIMRP